MAAPDQAATEIGAARLRMLKRNRQRQVEHRGVSTVHAHPTDRRRVLVVYFSRDGHTRRIARQIADACHADVDEIRAPGDRRGVLGYLRCALEALLGIEPVLQRGARLPDRYGLVVIGTPIWFWNVASPVRSWIVRHRDDLPPVALFCTFGGSGAAKVFADLERLCGRQAVATLAVTAAQCAGGQRPPQLRRFAAACNRGATGPVTGEPLERPAT